MIFTVGTSIIHLILYFFIKKKQKPLPPTQIGSQETPKTNLGKVVSAVTIGIFLGALGLSYYLVVILKRIDSGSADFEYFVHVYFTIFPVLLGIIINVMFFSSNVGLRNRARRMFVSNAIQPN